MKMGGAGIRRVKSMGKPFKIALVSVLVGVMPADGGLTARG